MPDLQHLLVELTSGNDARAEDAIPAILAFGLEAIPPLLELTHAKEIDSRWWAVRTLACSSHTRTEDLVPLLSDHAPEVRAAAALAICNHPHERAVPALITTLADDDPMVAGLAATALAKIGSFSVPALLQVMQEAPLGVRIHALRALVEINDHRAIPVLMNVLNTDSAILQYWAEEGLKRLGLDLVYIQP